MKNNETIKKNIGKRYLNENGIMMYYCRQCGIWRTEDKFYQKKDGIYGKNEYCNLHKPIKLTEEQKIELKENKHIHYSKLTDEDFENTKEYLKLLGYDTDGKKTVHEQFMEKWINKKK